MMNKEKYFSINSVKVKVEEKIKNNEKIKKKLKEAVKEVNSIDDIYKLLNYKVKNNPENSADAIRGLYKIQDESLSRNYKTLEKKNGRQAIFDRDKNDIVSKFRKSGITKLKTINFNTVRIPGNEPKSVIWDEIYKSWKNDMLAWINDEDHRLSNDEKKVNKIKYRFSDEGGNQQESDFGKEVLKNLNEEETFNIIKYENGEIDAAVNNIIVIDLFD